jgi:hypothetical protein
MKLAVTDACIFIDLCDTTLISPFFSLDINVHTSLDVYNELHSSQQQILSAYRSVGKLTIHNISPTERQAILQTVYPKALSEVDKTVLYLAESLNAMVISSDGIVRRFAEIRSTECHGLFWILDRLIAGSLLNTVQAAYALQQLMMLNPMYRGNKKLAAEIAKRLKDWGSN